MILPNDVLYVGLHLGGNRFEVLAGRLRRRPVLQPGDLGDEVRPGPDDVKNPEPLLPFTDEEEAVVHKPLVLHHLPHATDVGRAGGRVGVHHAEAQVGLEQHVHHNPVPELEDPEREHRAGEEDERQREERELHHVARLGGCGRQG